MYKSQILKAASVVLILWGLLLAGSAFSHLQSAPLSEQIRQQIEQRLINYNQEGGLIVGKEKLYFTADLQQFYQARHYNAVWMGENGLLPMAYDLMRLLKAADLEGLNPQDYHRDEISYFLSILSEKVLFRKRFIPSRVANIELLLSDAFIAYGTHLQSGRVDPKTVDPEWTDSQMETDMVKMLNQAILTGQVVETLDFLLPPQIEYLRLKKALQAYRSISRQGGWSVLEIDRDLPLQLGDQKKAVSNLRRRLQISNDLPTGLKDAEADRLFDDALVAAVSRFQQRHGLSETGMVDEATLKELNIPVADRIIQLIINLEHWRWLPHDLGNGHILVNIPGFELKLVQDDKTVLESRVVVGRSFRPTPVFSNTMTFLILNPFWYIPPTIATKDLLPQVQKDPGYLEKRHIKVFNSWEKNTEELDPFAIDWNSFDKDNLKYLFVQDPGPHNALGKVKFMFPNSLSIYLHDSPNKELFQESSREFSSGCIRVERSLALAEYLLKDNPGWNLERINKTIKAQTPTRINLARPIPVHLLYLTAWVSDRNIVHFRKDIYQRDSLLAKAMGLTP